MVLWNGLNDTFFSGEMDPWADPMYGYPGRQAPGAKGSVTEFAIPLKGLDTPPAAEGDPVNDYSDLVLSYGDKIGFAVSIDPPYEFPLNLNNPYCFPENLDYVDALTLTPKIVIPKPPSGGGGMPRKREIDEPGIEM